MTLEGFTDVSQILSAGVYALAKRGMIIYVGKAKNLYSRIYTHKHFANRGAKGQKIPSWLPIRGFVFDQVFVFPCRVDLLDSVEAEMVNKYKPKYNVSLKNGLKIKAPISLVINGVTVVMNKPEERIERRI